MSHLVHLIASSTRGIPRGWPALDLGERALVIYGPNGVGKSSIVDALESALGNESTLFPERRQGVSWDRAAPHVRDGAPTSQVTLRSDGQNWVIPGQSLAGDAANWAQAARTQGFLLRRHMLLRFITDDPSQRHRTLEGFLGFGQFNALEAALKNEVDRLVRVQEPPQQRLATLELEAAQTFDLREGQAPSEDLLLNTLNSSLVELGLPQCTACEDASDAHRRIQVELGGSERDAEITRLVALDGQLRRLGAPHSYVPNLELLLAATARLESEHVGRVIGEWLEGGKEILESVEVDACPLCEQQIDREQVLNRLAERIEADRRAINAVKLVERRRESARDHIVALRAAWGRLATEWEAVMGARIPAPYDHFDGVLGELEGALQSTAPAHADVHRTFLALVAVVGDDTKLLVPLLSAGLDCLAAEEFIATVPLAKLRQHLAAHLRDVGGASGEAHVESLKHRIAEDWPVPEELNASVTTRGYLELTQQISARLPESGASDRRTKLARAAVLSRWIADKLGAWRARRGEAQRAGWAARCATKLHGHAVEARKEAVQETLQHMASVANRYYELIHPNEGLGNSKLAVRRQAERSVTLTSEFDGEEEHPLLHYSESHLDTLGLCYFLAARRLAAERLPVFRLLVLDDVVHSVDADHRVRIVGLLKSEFRDHQVVITTHDRHFYELLRREFGTGGVNYVAIMRWSLESGPLLGDASTDLDRVTTSQRDTMAPDELAAAGGRVFEWLLRQLTERLEVSVRARFETRHVIGDLWPALRKKLTKFSGFNAVHSELVRRLDEDGWVRNACGAHYNEDASAVTPAEARSFAIALTELITATRCSGCGCFIAKVDDQTWKCECPMLGYTS